MNENDKDRTYKGIILIAIVLTLFSLSGGTSAVSNIINNINTTNFTWNVSGSSMVGDNITFVQGTNIVLTQDTINHKLTIDSTATGGVTNESVQPYNLNATNLSNGKIPYLRLNVSLCNPANQFSVFNQNTFNFDCVASGADDDSLYLLISTYNGVFPNLFYDNYQGAMNAMNQSNADNRTYSQSIFDLFNLTFAQQAINNTNINNTHAALGNNDSIINASISTLGNNDSIINKSISTLGNNDTIINTSISTLGNNDSIINTSITALKNNDTVINNSVSALGNNDTSDRDYVNVTFAKGIAFAKFNHTIGAQTTNILNYSLGAGNTVLSLPLTTGKMVIGECDLLTNASVVTISPQLFMNITGNNTMTISVEYYVNSSYQAFVSGTSANTSAAPTTSAGLTYSPVRIQFHSNQTSGGFFNVSMKASAAGMVQVDRGSYCRSIEI